MNLLDPIIPNRDLHNMQILAIAHIGDGVYELMTRTHLCLQGASTAKNLHNKSVKQVNAKTQAAAARELQDILNEEESDIFRRGKNAKSAVPKNVSIEDYKLATALEALFGYLYLSGNIHRLNELMNIIGGMNA